MIIKFETAKLAKEVGIIIESDFAWVEYDNGTKKCREVNSILWDNEYYAPTQSELQKWLRDEFKIHIEINLYDNSKTYHFEYRIITSNDRDWNDFNMMDSAKTHYNKEKFNTYEEALEEGLIESLKLIKNGKQ